MESGEGGFGAPPLVSGLVISYLFSFVVSFSLSSGIIRAPPPYRMVNAGLCDYKKKK